MLRLSIVFSVLLQSVGCATIVSGTKQSISVNSNVRGAKVFLNGQMLGVTPLVATVAKQQSANLRISKKGYGDEAIAMSTTLPVAFWGNIICGGFLGSTTDFASGAIYEYSSTNFYADLKKAGADDDEDDDDGGGKGEDRKRGGVHDREEDDGAALRREFRRFVLLSFEELRVDVARGEGEYLDALDDLTARMSGELKREDSRAMVVQSGDGLALLKAFEAKAEALREEG